MSLRSRLVLALLAMTSLGLAIFGVATYRAFASAEQQRLDDDLRASVPLVAQEMATSLRFGSFRPSQETPLVVEPGTYAQLRGPDGEPIASLQFSRGAGRPDLDSIGTGDLDGIVTVAGENDAGAWRALSEPTTGGGRLLVAAPTAPMERSLDQLLAIEVTAGTLLVGLLGVAAWLVLRRELRPLERITDTAAEIHPGELDRRVPAGSSASEVDQLARSINGMLDELEAAFRAREATEARLRRFLADASHELRTPLTSIQGFAELFRLDDERAQVELPVLMRRIEEEADRMRGLVEDLLLLARLDEPHPPRLGEVDLAVLAADACSDAVAGDPSRPVRLDAPEAVPVIGDEAHLRQALGNLLSNAVQHTPPGTPIDVAVAHREQGPTVTVRDHGPGIDDAVADRLFDRFWQADPSRTGSGVGLGLSIVQAVAAEHGGEVGAANAADGGAVFTLRLPSEHGAREVEPDPTPAAGPPPPPVGEDAERDR